MEMQDDSSQFRHLLPAEPGPSHAHPASESGPPPASKHPKRRAPITNVACQECRKRKTKCDGVRPACSNCQKRGLTHCQYDTEGTQSSKIAYYRSKINTQTTRIADLESENSRLKEATSRGNSSTPSNLSLPLPFQALSMNASSLQQLPSLTPASSASKSLSSSSSSGIILNPMHRLRESNDNRSPSHRLPHEDASNRYGHLRHHNAGTAFSPAERRPGYEDELSQQQHQKLSLQEENQRLKEIMVFLTTLDDRSVAEALAVKIKEEGLTDDLLIRINSLYASGRGGTVQQRQQQQQQQQQQAQTNCNAPENQQQQQHNPRRQASRSRLQTPRLPALSSLDLPSLSAPSTPDLEPTMHNGPYSLPPIPSHKSLREGW